MRKLNRYLSIVLAAAMLIGIPLELPLSAQAANAGQAIDVYLGQGRVGNSAHDADDIFNNFNASVAGFSKSGKATVNGGSVSMEDPDKYANFSINISGNEQLKQLAKSSTAQYCVTGWVKSDGGAYHWTIPGHNDYERGYIGVSDSSGYSKSVTASHDSVDDSKKDLDTGWRSLTNLSSITIKVENRFSCDTDGDNWNDDGAATAEVHLYIRDNTCPKLSSYTATNKATVNADNSKELLMKLGVKNANSTDDYYYDASQYNSDDAAKASRDWISLQFNFSKPVTIATPNGSGGLSGAGDNAYKALATHTLFTNTLGTGFTGQGEPRSLTLTQNSSQVNSYISSISYRYTATYGDFSGNSPIPAKGGIESNTGYSYGTSLMTKIDSAGFHDAAGNPLQGVDGSKGSNIFDKSESGGYDVIVDAMPPTYSRVGNGIYPDILTDVIINKNDTVDFIVSFSEAVITKRGWSDSNTYLLLDNGGRANFAGKSSDDKRWTFRYEVPGGNAAEATLLKVIALMNTAQGEPNGGNGPVTSGSDYAAYSYNFDGRTITDYVGNIMVERANNDPGKNSKQINSFTGWAGLAVDNTAPNFEFKYMPYGSGTSTYPGDKNSWGQAVKLYATAIDPEVRVANYDPDYSSDNTSRPSKGIYRPDNTTGSAGSAIGLIFYTWTRDPQPPDTGDNFEAVKRYSLTGEQPGTVTDKAYSSAWKDYMLQMENNYSNITPPDEAMTSSGDGAWYLHVWTADMTWDSARQLMQYDLAKAQQYNSNGSKLYTADDMIRIKSEKTEAYKKANSTSYDNAWKAVRAEVYTQIYTTQFLYWLAKIDASASNKDEQLQAALGQDAMYTDTSMAYARAQATLTQAMYDDKSVWKLDMFNKEDSNWTADTARVLLDNTVPEVSNYGNITGNNTVSAAMTATVTDALSGIDTESIRYQWVAKDKEPGIDWTAPTDISSTDVSNGLSGAAYGKASVTFTAQTSDHVFDSGEYVLYVECSDMAGNSVRLDSGETTVKVNMNNTIVCTFGPEEAVASYQKEIAPAVSVTGMLINKVEYAITQSIDRPADGYTEIAATSEDADKMQYDYTLPVLDTEDGVCYVHILATGITGDAQYFRGSYLVDRTAPEIYVNNLGVAADKNGVNAQINILDTLSGAGEKAYYQVLKTTEPPASDDEGWIELPEDKKITITGEPAVYYIHIKATDAAGNEKQDVSKPFELKTASDEPMELPEYASQLITVDNGYGIANLLLETDNKDGYRYSISTDGGNKWCNWLPYMSMIRMKLPEDYTDQGKLKVKFRAPDGTVGEVKDIVTNAIVNEPIWATAEFDSTLKRRTGKTLTFIMTLADGTQYRPTGTESWRTNNFTVTENGVYSFELKKGTTVAATQFTVVVDIFDDIAPSAYLSYSDITPTNSNVLVTVNSDEPVYVKSIRVKLEGDADESDAPSKMQYSFERNGEAVFTVCDEAENETILNAKITNIDKTAPKVKITENYDNYEVFGSVASGVTLTVEKQTSADEDFTVVGTNQSYSLEAAENGVYSFIVKDAVGNVTGVSKTVTNISKELPEYSISYTYAKSGGVVSVTAPKKEDVRARAVFEKMSDGRKLYFGTAPAKDGSNELATDGSGNYFTERTYSQSGHSTMVVSDSLGNVLRIPVTVEGIDKTAPTITLNAQQAVITPTAKKLSQLSDSELTSLFGGYTISDNAYAAEDITVTVSRSDDFIRADEDKGDLSTPGAYTVVYTVTDPAGNTARVEQPLVVIPGDGLLVKADKAILSGAMSNTAIVPSNHVTFSVDPQRMQAMFYGNDKQKVYNKSMRYDIYYVSGLYREGQLKTIASKLTAEELVSRNFSADFPKAGWYTIIIRNQERTREYTTFFVSSYTD